MFPSSFFRTWHIVLFATILRLLLWFCFYAQHPDQLKYDDEIYFQAYTDLHTQGMIQSDKVMPGLPLLALLTGGFPNIVYLILLLDIVGIILLAKITFHITGNKAVARLAAFLLSIEPFFLYFSNHFYTEIPYSTFLLAAYWLFLQQKWNWGILILNLNILIRPSMEPINLVFVGLFVWILTQNKKLLLQKVLLSALVYLLCLAPWWIHNYQKYGQFVRLNLGAGEVLYHGQVNLVRNTSGNLYDTSVYSLKEFLTIQNPIERNQAEIKATLDFLQENPSRLGISIYRNFVKFWLTSDDIFFGKAKVLVMLYQLFLLLLFLFFIVKNYRKIAPAWYPALFLMLYFTFTHCLLHGMARYRMPLIPYQIAMGVSLLPQFLSYIRKKM